MARTRPPSQTDRAVAIGAELRRLRRQAGLTQRELAAVIPMSPANLSRIEAGEQGPPSDEALVAFAEALETDVSELLAISGRSIVGPDVATELRALRDEMRAGFARIEKLIG